MAQSVAALIILAAMAGGCTRRPRGSPAALTERPAVLELRHGAPVSPRCELLPLPERRKSRQFFTFDLNDDGEPEFFVENHAGANTMGFALVDASGRLLLFPRDVGEFGGHRIVILNHRSNGYRDMINSYHWLGEVTTVSWRFSGRRYVRGAYVHMKPDVWQDTLRIPGAAAAVWRAFAVPE